VQGSIEVEEEHPRLMTDTQERKLVPSEEKARVEHFLHNIETKLKEKKQENSSSHFDHSRASF